MVKNFLKLLLASVALYAQQVLALWAEAGPQSMVPHFRSNTDYSSLGAVHNVFIAATGAYAAQLATDPGSSLILGVLQNAPQQNEAMSIAVSGVSKVVAGGALTVNAIITTNASGRAAAVASGQIGCGRVLETAGADGDVVTALLFHPVRWAGAA